MDMQAIVLNEFGDDRLFQEKKVPAPLPKQGEVRICVKAAAFNPVDCKIRKGSYGGQPPLILGADCSGVIDQVGPGVTQFSVGDEVMAMPFGQCSNGSYAQYLCLPWQFVTKKPKKLSFEEASSIPLTTLTAYRAMVATHALENKGSIFIAGAAGGVGSVAVQLARHFHGGPIYTIAGSEETKAFLCEKLQFKPNEIVLYKDVSKEELEKKLLSLNAGKGFSSSFDFVGREMKKFCVAITAHSGHVASILPTNPNTDAADCLHIAAACFAKNLSFHSIFVGAESYSGTPDTWNIYWKHLLEIAKLIESGKLFPPSIKNLGKLSVSTVQEAHRLLEEGKVKGKLIMQVG